MHGLAWRRLVVFFAALSVAAASDEALALGLALGIPAVVVGAILSESHRILSIVMAAVLCVGLLGACAHLLPRAGFLPRNLEWAPHTEQVALSEQEKAKRAILKAEEAKTK
mmetsp:Transcript_23980/g.55355  ORF Transcript_23980/g.55355 Transcript_23980/m.55355 type:complete len:111 (-) Transcript_23980:93-425(-)